MSISIINKNKQKTVFVKTHWRDLKPVNGVNNLFYDTFIWFYNFLIIKIDYDIRVTGVVFS